MPKTDEPIVFNFEDFKKFAASKSGEYDYEDIEFCAIGQYITSLLGAKHDRYFMRVDPAGKVYLRALGPYQNQTIDYPWQLDKVLSRSETWENLSAALDTIRPEVLA